MTMAERRPPPWSIEERTESFIVKDGNGQQLAYLYFEDEPQRAMSMKGLSASFGRLLFASAQLTWLAAWTLVLSQEAPPRRVSVGRCKRQVGQRP
jgi:hypothetical protein